MAVLGADKENISLGADSSHVSLRVALSVLLKMERVVRSTRRVDTLEPLLGRKVACLC